ncbi:uncharacterized protein C8Q71DRAFT_773107 [Rhodofomes roseus]|uniref:F-box domain-containing protein n=1 Tax=Rhodofomes roseus TaxID=34475 RepID=A0ABQ8K867_9APHY|nr:uncharacterized protein C8Q71DRAFT_773107 [Rhodofomes roseus]KAH9833384.1 hypothetical protein C8Q71DRAFT_773107 [Rhodofomes roseus]
MEYQAPSSDSDRSISENGRIFYRPRITTNDLPADVLVIILEEAFCAVRELYTKREAGRPDPIELNSWPSFEDCIPENPFAESLASVSSIWREVMSSVSTFWSPLIIWLGRDSTPISRIRQYLFWSRKQPLEIYVLRRYDPAIADQTEKERVAAILELLLPHVQRWKVLCLKLLYASSLPRPRFELLGCADHLVRLNLDFIIDDTVGSTMTTAPVPGVFKTPMVHELSMHGRHFLESYMGPYPSYVVPPKLARLALTNYARAPRNNSRTVEFFSLLSLVESLVARPDLRLLHLENLELDCVCYVWPGRLTPTQHRWDVNVNFVDMCGDVIADFSGTATWTILHTRAARSLTDYTPRAPIPSASRSTPASPE